MPKVEFASHDAAYNRAIQLARLWVGAMGTVTPKKIPVSNALFIHGSNDDGREIVIKLTKKLRHTDNYAYFMEVTKRE